jgi:methyl-accepting chemotaxis protein
MIEQARAIKDLSNASRDVAKQIGLINRSNRDHLTGSATILATLTEIREITDRNAKGAQETLRGSAGLVDRAQSLNSIVDGAMTNGLGRKKSRKKKKGKK